MLGIFNKLRKTGRNIHNCSDTLHK